MPSPTHASAVDSAPSSSRRLAPSSRSVTAMRETARRRAVRPAPAASASRRSAANTPSATNARSCCPSPRWCRKKPRSTRVGGLPLNGSTRGERVGQRAELARAARVIAARRYRRRGCCRAAPSTVARAFDSRILTATIAQRRREPDLRVDRAVVARRFQSSVSTSPNGSVIFSVPIAAESVRDRSCAWSRC